MTKRTTLALAFVFITGCATTRHDLPPDALSYGSARIDDGKLRLRVEPIYGAVAVRRDDAAAIVHWREHPAYRAWPSPDDPEQVLYVPLVPRPSLEVTIHNDADEALTFDRARIALNDDSGAKYHLVTSAKDLLPNYTNVNLVGSAVAWLARLGWNPIDQPVPLQPDVPPGARLSEETVRDAALALPLFGNQVVVPAHGVWRGALVFTTDANTTTDLVNRLAGNLYLSWSGASFGYTHPAAPVEITVPLTAPARRQACMEIIYPTTNIAGRGRGLDANLAVINGAAVSHADAEAELVSLPASSREGRKAVILRVVGDVLMGAGVVGTVAVAAALGSSSESSNTPASTAMLGLSVVGGVLNYVGYRHEQHALKQYNRAIANSGACTPPN